MRPCVVAVAGWPSLARVVRCVFGRAIRVREQPRDRAPGKTAGATSSCSPHTAGVQRPLFPCVVLLMERR